MEMKLLAAGSNAGEPGHRGLRRRVLAHEGLISRYATTRFDRTNFASAAAPWVDHLDVGNSTKKMGVEVVAASVILTLRTISAAIRQNSFQAIVIRSRDVQVCVHHDARQPLANTLPHDSRLSVMNGESLLNHRRTDVNVEPLGNTIEVAFARECQIVSVSGVGCSHGFREAEQPEIQPVRTEIRDSPATWPHPAADVAAHRASVRCALAGVRLASRYLPKRRLELRSCTVLPASQPRVPSSPLPERWPEFVQP